MRLLFGIILGGVLTVGAAYLYDSHNAVTALEAPASAQRPLVNWDVASVKWQHMTDRARQAWHRVTANIDADRATRSSPPQG